MKNYPMHFKVNGTSNAGTHSSWQSRTQGSHNSFKSDLTLAIPPEFDGPGNGFSPEDLYALALQNCFIATFKVFAEKSKLAYRKIETESVLTLDRNDKGQPWMARFHLQVTLKGVEQPENALRILDKVSKNCMILNSVQTKKIFEFKVEPI